VHKLRTGAEYREALRDGRKVWVIGAGAVEDVTTHPATRAMVDEYVAWYDRHFDPAWQDTVLTGDRLPWGYVLPKTADDLVGWAKCSSTMHRRSRSPMPMRIGSTSRAPEGS
jgi:4-hydroxyphenylacetate 3-monooxygenase